MDIKKIIREEIDDFGWIESESPSDEVLHGGTDLGDGYYWHIKSYSEWEDLYNNVESIQNLKPKWVINPSLKSTRVDPSKYFGMYQQDAGNLNIFLPHDRGNAYAWFDEIYRAFDKDNKSVEKPI